MIFPKGETLRRVLGVEKFRNFLRKGEAMKYVEALDEYLCVGSEVINKAVEQGLIVTVKFVRVGDD